MKYFCIFFSPFRLNCRENETAELRNPFDRFSSSDLQHGWDHDRGIIKWVEGTVYHAVIWHPFSGAQGELSHSQEFTESQFIRHRFRVSSILESLTKISIDLYFDSLSIVRTTADDTRQQMTMLQPNSCTEDAIGRWNRQVTAYNYQLNYCLSESKRILQGEYDDLNYFDKDGARVSNHTPNQSFNMMLQHDIVQAGTGFYKIVNNRLRDLLLRAGRKFSSLNVYF